MKMIVWCVLVLGAVSAAGKVVVTHVGKKVIMDCGVSTFNQLLAWYHREGLILRLDGKTGFFRRGTAPVLSRSSLKLTKLVITGVTEADVGKFSCEADGKKYQHTLLVVSTSVVPSRILQLGSEATLRCQAKGLDPDSLVQWRSPNGQLAGSEEVQLKSVAKSDEGIWQCVFSFDQEMFSENVTITVKDGIQVPTMSAPIIPNGSESPRVTGPPVQDGGVQLLGLSWWVWLALGLGCLVSVLLLVFAVILCLRIRRKKRKKFLRMKNVPQPLRPRKYCNCDHPTAAAKPQQGRRREKPSALPL